MNCLVKELHGYLEAFFTLLIYFYAWSCLSCVSWDPLIFKLTTNSIKLTGCNLSVTTLSRDHIPNCVWQRFGAFFKWQLFIPPASLFVYACMVSGVKVLPLQSLPVVSGAYYGDRARGTWACRKRRLEVTDSSHLFQHVLLWIIFFHLIYTFKGINGLSDLSYVQPPTQSNKSLLNTFRETHYYVLAWLEGFFHTTKTIFYNMYYYLKSVSLA